MTRLLMFLVLAQTLAGFSACQTAPPAILDFGGLPQDTSFYLSQPDLDLTASPALQKERFAEFLNKLLEPWGDNPPVPSVEEVITQFKKLRAQGGYGENLRPRSEAWYDELWLLSDLDAYPNTVFKATTLTATDLRVLPTMGPVFDTPRVGGGGYPFDRLQQSRVAPNTPVLVLNVSRNGEWAFVNCHYAWGWIHRRDLARVHDEHVKCWRGDRFAAVIKDGTEVRDKDGRLLFVADVGTILPLFTQKFNEYQVMAATVDDEGWASIKQANLSATQAVAMPMALSAKNVAAVANQFLGRPYGWGGYLGNRDCSSLVKDLYTPFGLWLPRNSADQAQHGGGMVELSGFSKATVLDGQAVPFLSLIWMPGHIMIYLGQYSGQEAIMHSLWGGGKPGENSNPVGRVVITPLEGEGGGLLQRAQGFVNLVNRDQLQR